MSEPFVWAWGWWEKRRRHELPTCLKDERNYLLTVDELAEYMEVLKGMKAVIDAEHARVRLTHKALGSYVIGSLEGTPQPISLAHVLQFQVNVGKQKLAFMRWLVECTQKRFGHKPDVARWENEGGRHG